MDPTGRGRPIPHQFLLARAALSLPPPPDPTDPHADLTPIANSLTGFEQDFPTYPSVFDNVLWPPSQHIEEVPPEEVWPEPLPNLAGPALYLPSASNPAFAAMYGQSHQRVRNNLSHPSDLRHVDPVGEEWRQGHQEDRRPHRPDLFADRATAPRAPAAPAGNDPGMSHPSSSSSRPAKRNALPPAAADRNKRRRVHINDDDLQRSDEIEAGGIQRANRTAQEPADGEIEEIDLATQEPADVKQRQDQEELQNRAEEGQKPRRFQDMTCIICMDVFTDLSATPCGHIFCHECLTQAIMAGERGDRGTGSCPVCRKTLKRTTKNHIIPLAFMTRKKYEEGRRA